MSNEVFVKGKRALPARIWGEAVDLLSGASFKASIREFKNLRVVVFCGLMAAASILLSFTASIQMGPFIRIGFANVPNVLVGYLFGPFVGMIFGGSMDIIKFILKPTGGFFPGFTLTAILGGMIHGLTLYRHRITLPRVFLSQFLIKLLLNVGLNSLWLKIMYGKAIFAMLPVRGLSNLIMLPIDTAIFYFLLRAFEKTLEPMIRKGSGSGKRRGRIVDKPGEISIVNKVQRKY